MPESDEDGITSSLIGTRSGKQKHMAVMIIITNI
jgi:hypothetical protein